LGEGRVRVKMIEKVEFLRRLMIDGDKTNKKNI